MPDPSAISVFKYLAVATAPLWSVAAERSADLHLPRIMLVYQTVA